MKKFLIFLDVIHLICSAKESSEGTIFLKTCLQIVLVIYRNLIINKSVPDRNVQEKILEVMVHHECVIIEDSSSVDIGDGDQVPDNVREQIMRAPHLDQVLCLL